MKITAIRIFPAARKPGTTRAKFVASAEIELDDEFRVCDLRIFEGAKGRFVSYPQSPFRPDFAQVAYPLSYDLRMKIERAILAEIDKLDAAREVVESCVNGAWGDTLSGDYNEPDI